MTKDERTAIGMGMSYFAVVSPTKERIKDFSERVKVFFPDSKLNRTIIADNLIRITDIYNEKVRESVINESSLPSGWKKKTKGEYINQKAGFMVKIEGIPSPKGLTGWAIVGGKIKGSPIDLTDDWYGKYSDAEKEAERLIKQDVFGINEKAWDDMNDKEKKFVYKKAIDFGNVKDSFEGFSKMMTSKGKRSDKGKNIFSIKTGKPVEINW